jgi:ferredoxin--NADP+ reductase
MGLTVEPGLQIFHAAASENRTAERVLSVRYWTPTLLSFRTTRNRGFRFTPGHYARLGLDAGDGTMVWRPYSMVSAAYDEHLEFLAVLVPGGAFSAPLARLQVGDTIHVEKASYGFLTVDQLAPGRDLWLLASGTGLGPFLSILRDPVVWQGFERLIVVHSVRQSAELAYRDEIAALADDPLFAESAAQLVYLPVVTRELGATALASRIPQLFADGQLAAAAGRPISVDASRLMICGNPEMARELRQMLGALGFATNRRGVAGQMAFEKYW